MSRSLKDLASYFRPLATELIAQAAEAGIAVAIISTGRTFQEQIDNVSKGVSWTMDSKHLPQPPEQKSEAIDIAPYEVYLEYGPDKFNWNPDDPVWDKLGAIGESLGLRWGGRWIYQSGPNKGKKKDPGHFEWRKPSGFQTDTKVA